MESATSTRYFSPPPGRQERRPSTHSLFRGRRLAADYSTTPTGPVNTSARLRASHALRPGAGIVPLVRGFRNKVIEPLFRQALVHILGQPWFTVEHRKMSNAKFNCLDLLPRCQPLCKYGVVGRLHMPGASKNRVYQHRNFPLTVFAPQHQGILPLHLPRSNSRMYGSYGCRTS